MEDTFTYGAAERGVGRREDGEVIACVTQDSGNFGGRVAAKDGVDLLEELDAAGKSFYDVS